MIFKNDLKKIASPKRYYLFYTFVCGGEDGSHYIFKILKFIILLRYSHCYPLWIILSYNSLFPYFHVFFHFYYFHSLSMPVTIQSHPTTISTFHRDRNQTLLSQGLKELSELQIFSRWILKCYCS